jgi:hypothetical protein
MAEEKKESTPKPEKITRPPDRVIKEGAGSSSPNPQKKS